MQLQHTIIYKLNNVELIKKHWYQLLFSVFFKLLYIIIIQEKKTTITVLYCFIMCLRIARYNNISFNINARINHLSVITRRQSNPASLNKWAMFGNRWDSFVVAWAKMSDRIAISFSYMQCSKQLDARLRFFLKVTRFFLSRTVQHSIRSTICIVGNCSNRF